MNSLRRVVLCAGLGLAAVFMTGCVIAPPSFVKTMAPTWASVEIREGVQFEDAWSSVTDLLVKNFDLEVISKENGYIRTGWLYTWTGRYTAHYRVRITTKFSQDRKKLEIKSEANLKTAYGWQIGTDTALLQTLKTDIMGTIGRVTR